METESKPRAWVTCVVAAAVSLIVIEPALLWVRHADKHLPYEESHWYTVLLLLTFLIVPCVIGIAASRRHTDYPLRTAALATLASTGIIVLFAILHKTSNDASLPAEYIIKYLIYLQFTIALSVIAAYLTLRMRVMRSAT